MAKDKKEPVIELDYIPVSVDGVDVDPREFVKDRGETVGKCTGCGLFQLKIAGCPRCGHVVS